MTWATKAGQRIALSMLCFGLLGSCSPSDPPSDGFRDQVTLSDVGPSLLLRGSTLRILGGGFVHPDYGTNQLHLLGDVSGRSVDLVIATTYLAEDALEAQVGEEVLAAIPVGARFSGGARIETTHRTAGPAQSGALAVELEMTDQLVPRWDLSVPSQIFINSEIDLSGSGVLFGGEEGGTTARIWGCFFRGGGGCEAVDPVEVTVWPRNDTDRDRAFFRFEPQIAGVSPGIFRGSVQIINRHGADRSGMRINQDPVEVETEVLRPQITSVNETAASLGQYITVEGGGFVPADSASLTLLVVQARFEPEGEGRARTVNLTLVPEVMDGGVLRYLLNETDQLGEQINLRRERGRLAGVVSVNVRHGEEEVTGATESFSFRIAPIRQVVYVSFQPSYRETLRAFGLRALRPLINQRVLEAAQAPYVGVSVEFRDELPEDFALYSTVDLAGPDPNGLGLFGYDNTPGKDTNNLRLFDRIGGVNATTQEDGFPGYGGVFLDSFFGFSSDPAGRAMSLPSVSPLFDQIFDPFRPDRDGRPVDAGDLRAGLGDARGGRACPARDRPTQIACAVWVLGNLVGSTVAHEVGHSIGLADPEGDAFHNDFDGPNRLMDWRLPSF